MKIKKKVFEEFLEKARMTGKQAIDETLFKFTEDGLIFSANSPAQLSRVEAELTTEAFADYEAIGNIGVDKLGTLILSLKRFSDTISISKSGNLLTLKEDKKSVDIELVSEDFITADKQPPKFVYEEEFTISGDNLAEVFKDAKLNIDAEIIIETKPDAVVFKNTGKFKFTSEFDVPSCKGGVVAKFGEALIESTAKLKGDLIINIKNDYPMTVTEKTDISTIKLIIAPRVDKTKNIAKKVATPEVKEDSTPEEESPQEVPAENSEEVVDDTNEEKA